MHVHMDIVRKVHILVICMYIWILCGKSTHFSYMHVHILCTHFSYMHVHMDIYGYCEKSTHFSYMHVYMDIVRKVHILVICMYIWIL